MFDKAKQALDVLLGKRSIKSFWDCTLPEVCYYTVSNRVSSGAVLGNNGPGLHALYLHRNSSLLTDEEKQVVVNATLRELFEQHFKLHLKVSVYGKSEWYDKTYTKPTDKRVLKFFASHPEPIAFDYPEEPYLKTFLELVRETQGLTPEDPLGKYLKHLKGVSGIYQDPIQMATVLVNNEAKGFITWMKLEPYYAMQENAYGEYGSVWEIPLNQLEKYHSDFHVSHQGKDVFVVKKLPTKLIEETVLEMY